MRIIFMGTPDFALPSLKALLHSSENIIAVVTQPDRPKGRGQTLSPSPIKMAAQNAGIFILQPHRLKDSGFLEELKRLNPDLIVVVAYGKILPSEVLHLPPRGCINVHASLLPKYRGAAPIAWAIIHGETQTGVTTIHMDEGLDTGEIYLQETSEILPSDTTGTLAIRLSEIGAKLLLKTVKGILDKTLTVLPQDHTRATVAPLLTKEHGVIDWMLPADQIANRVRGLDPWPGAYTSYAKDRWKLWRVAASDLLTDKPPGEIVKVEKTAILVATGRGVLAIQQIQVGNSKKMSVRDWLAGHSIKTGNSFG